MSKKSIIFSLLLIILALVWFYRPMIGHYFYQDEFYNLSFRAGDSFSKVISDFNIFKPSPKFPFYRPLTTQFFFWLGYQFFGLSPYGYNLILLIFFLATVVIVYFITYEITSNNNLSFLTAFFYGFSASNIYRLYNKAQFQEIGLGFFYLLTIYLYIISRKKGSLLLLLFSVFSFLLALMSKETAVTLPIILFFYELIINFRKRNIKKTGIFFLLVLFYLLVRYFFFGFAKGGVYAFTFSIKSIINSILWYFLWSLGLLENMADVKVFNQSIVPSYQLVTDFGSSGVYVSVFFIIFSFWLFLSLKLLIDSVRINDKIKKKTFYFLLWAITFFILTIFPVSLFPFHKFAYSLTLPVYGTALFCGILALYLYRFSKLFYTLLLINYLFISFYNYNYVVSHHWSFKRPVEVARIFNFLKVNYPRLNGINYFYIFDGLNPDQLQGKKSKAFEPASTFPSWELSQALSNEKGIQLFYKNKDLVVEYEYFKLWFYCPRNKKVIYLSAKQFI